MKPILAIGLMSGTSIDGSISVALLRTDGDEVVERIAVLEYPYESGEGHTLRPVHHFTKAAEIAYRDARGDHAVASAHYPHAVDRYFRETFPNDSAPVLAERRAQCEEEFLKRLPHHRSHNRAEPSHTGVSLEAVIECSTIVHAEAVELMVSQQGISPSTVSLVGYHGQTLYHAPSHGVTVQVGDAPYLATRLGIPVIYDFRSNDVAHGGQGAPLAPVYHRALARKVGLSTVCVLNLGGTANITVILEGGESFLAFDTGPANGLIDKWVKERAHQPFDRGSELANRGHVNTRALQVLLDRAIIMSDGRNYLEIPAPKSLDIRDYHFNFPEVTTLSLEDGCATLNAFTAECIVRGLRQASAVPTRWIVCGGGVHNVHVLAQLRERVRAAYGVEIEMLDAASVGWSSAAMEAELFAFLAVRSDRGLPLTYPQTTGVATPLCGGRRQEP